MTSWIVHRLFETIEQYPENIAVSQGGRQTTYNAFGQMVSALAARFEESSEAPRVAICAEPSAETYAAMFAAMLAGGFYVPLNAEVGQTRLQTAFKEIAPNIAVFSERTSQLAAAIGYLGPIIITSNVPYHCSRVNAARPAHRLAYVMFTSGSTGTPKGVMISQNALGHYARWAQTAMSISASDRWSQHPNIGFDLSVLDIYGALLGGATLYPLNEPMDRLLPARAIRKYKLTIWNSVPSVMGMILKSGDWNVANAASLRLMTFCGEPLLPEHVEGIFNVLPHVEVHNTYGPTEATVSCSLVKLMKENYRQHAKSSIALGDPIPGTEFFIDGDTSGELLIAGLQLAEGYWNDPAKTAKAFRLVRRDGRDFMAYHTGDFVRRDSTGLYFSERQDGQVKIKGHRIELNEISSHIRKLGYIHVESIVEGQSIIAFIEGDGNEDAEQRIRQYLTHELESYMQPHIIAFIAKFPRNANDKIDLATLRAACDMPNLTSL